jgi:hypothetical protein
MPRGLARKNNLSDLPSAEQARINLGLATADYNRIRGLYTSAGVSNVDIQRIANSAGNYQGQIDGLNTSLSGIVPSLYVTRSGDTISSGWTNYGYIQPGQLVQSGVTLSGSSDSLFSLSVSGLSCSLSTSTLTMQSGVTVQRFSDSGGVVFASGITPDRLVPMQINGVPYFVEAG